MKKHLLSILACCMCAGAFATEYATATEGTTYYGSGCSAIGLTDGTVAVYAFYASSTDVTIPHDLWSNTADGDGNYPCYEVSQVGYNDGTYDWNFSFSGSATASTLTSLTISEGIKKMVGKGFWGCTSMTTLTLPSTLTEISTDYMFQGCTALAKIVCNATSAPTLQGQDFPYDLITNKSCTVVVPDGAASAYKTDDWTYWQAFYNNSLVREATWLTMTSAGYSTYYNDYGFVMPEGLEGYAINWTYDGSANLLKVYEAGDEVVAKMPLLIKATSDVAETQKIEIDVLASYGNTATWPMTDDEGNISASGTNYLTNLLAGTQTATAISVTSGYYYYKLANDATNGLGWYWGAEDGGSFTNGAHKAYLAVSQSSGAKPFISLGFDDDITAIKTVSSEQKSAPRKFINAHGQIQIGNYNVLGQKIQ